MSALAGLRRRGLILLVVGVAIIGVAIALYASGPAEPSSEAFLRGDASMDEVSAHSRSQMRSIMIGMAGGFMVFVGLGHILAGDRTLRSARGELVEETAASVARGFAEPASPKARLAQLESLRRDGLVTDAEYEAKRREVLAQL